MDKIKSLFSWFPFTWRDDKITICILAGLLTILLVSNTYGYRVCNCTSTDTWKPGNDRTARSHSGVHYFYHK
ncbi:hypothetical protein SAMN05444266_11536 [Chitinophaga jiangningensis]|uniref:Uncharacterized protein n=1 Tax=Chitinophaga jiangningensis TaxID=1419482 RepID=A0A1M7MWL0_9BACT|nr:hypothetical protein [Chitinophaga jiangningensis]SHM95439.1 hypothetical protein SAMN05444266_11536 [Chitinophaga jiangningensis]